MASHKRSSIAAKPGAYTAVRPLISSPMTSATLSPLTGDSRWGE